MWIAVGECAGGRLTGGQTFSVRRLVDIAILVSEGHP